MYGNGCIQCMSYIINLVIWLYNKYWNKNTKYSVRFWTKSCIPYALYMILHIYFLIIKDYAWFDCVRNKEYKIKFKYFFNQPENTGKSPQQLGATCKQNETDVVSKTSSVLQLSEQKKGGQMKEKMEKHSIITEQEAT